MLNRRQTKVLGIVIGVAFLSIIAVGFFYSGTSADEEFKEVGNWDELKNYIETYGTKTIKLVGAVDAFYGYEPFSLVLEEIPGQHRTVTIDLNGHNINRGCDHYEDYFDQKLFIVKNNVTFIIKDSSVGKQGGMIRCWSSGTSTDKTCIGGIIYNDGEVIIEGGTFRSNQAQLDGGAIYNAKGAVLTIKGGTFSLNCAERNGGAIYNEGMVTIEGGSFAGNIASYGGAIYNKGLLNISGGFMYTNEAEYAGGAIYNDDGGKVLINGTNLSDNMSRQGSAIYNKSSLVWVDDNGDGHYAVDIRNADLDKNYVTNLDAGYEGVGEGAAVWNSGYLSISDSVLEDNTADVNGGAIANTGVMLVSGSTLSNNEAEYNGGAVINYGETARLTVSDSTFRGNDSPAAGAIYNSTEGSIYEGSLETGVCISGSTFDSNTSSGSGGAIYNKGAMLVSGSMFKWNVADDEGGAIRQLGSNLVINDTHFENNTSEGDGGGAIYIEDGVVDAYGLIAEYNTASTGKGGAIYIEDGVLNLEDSMIDQNKALLHAGAILLEDSGQLNIKGLIHVCNNTAMMSRNILLEEGATIGLFGKVHVLSTVDFAMENIYDPFTNHFNSELCNIGVFFYNEVSGDGFHFDQRVVDDTSELFVDIDLWNQKLGAILVTDWEELRECLKDDDNGDKLEIALAKDICRPDDGEPLVIKRDVILDLNGFTLDGDFDDYDLSGTVIHIDNDVDAVIKDGVGTGRITGGCGVYGGGIGIGYDSKLTFEGGTICGNKAVEGGGISVEGELEMTGGAIYDNYGVDNGGGIYIHGVANISNAIIVFNSADDDGAGLYYNAEDEDCTIRNCEISYNVSDGDGGAIYMTSEDMTLSIIDCIINHNEADSDGGAIWIGDGDVIIGGNTEICYNDTDDDGGAIYTQDPKVTITGNVTINHNSAGDQGGAIYTDEGKIDIDGVVDISYNEADEGGGIFTEDATVTIRSGTTLSYNEADGNGGAIYVDDDGSINLWGGTIIYNTAKNGGGVYMSDDSDDIAVSGDLVVMYNDATDGNGIYLSEDNHIDVDGPLADTASILVASENGTGRFTKNYSKYNDDRDPSTFFISSEGFLVILEDGEAVFTAKRTGSVGEEDFIGWESQIVDYYSISDKNWMSGISGDRRLNEINIPGTHDSGMRSTKCHFNASIGDFAHMSKMAQTQALYIDEQLNAGVRILDIRINNQHLVPYDGWNIWAYSVGLSWSALTWDDGMPYELEDDGENLWICHGKNATGGTFYARDHDGDDLSVDQALDWIKDFLTLHPTETIMVGFSAEVQGDDEDNVQITNDRIFDILSDMYDEINPSTGKPFIYRVGDSPLGTSLTEYPYLKDVRGQIVLYNNELLGGITSDTIGDVTESYSQDVGYDCSIDDKRQSIYRFFDEHVDGVDLPRDVTTHLTVRHSIGMNVGPTDTVYYIGKYFQSFYDHDIGPMHNAHVLLPEFFADGKPFDQRGKYVGWVKTDGATAENYVYVWKSNFPDYLNYATVTVESGLGEHYKQTYKLLVGTKITLPGCIYEDIGELIFDGWSADGEQYASGTDFIISGDVTFIANWRDTNVYTITFVDYDDTLLEVFHYNEGTSAEDIVDLAPSPTKPADVQYTYTFAGWDPEVTDAVADATYKAVYDSTLNKYTVTWMTYDGVDVIETDEDVEYGTKPSYHSDEPTKEETEQHTYRFIGWSEDVDSESGWPVEELPAVTGDIVYYAAFAKVIKQYHVTFLNWDDTVYFEGDFAIETEPNIFVPINNPTRPPDDDGYYEFSGWSPKPSPLMEDTTYEAEFKQKSELRYCVKFLDWDATVLSEDMYEAGTDYSDIDVPDDPSRSPTTQFSYTFKGWSPEVPSSGELTDNVIFMATYNYIVNQYTITFVDWNGNQLSQESYDFGTDPDDIVRPADPTREQDPHYTYTFAGWTPTFTKVMTDETYTAVYTETVRIYTVTWKNYDGEVLETDEVPFGDIPTYDGGTPTRPDSDADTFTFQGWSPGIQYVSGDAEYTADYLGVGRVFTITYDPNGGYFKSEKHQGHESYQHGYKWWLYNNDRTQGEQVARDNYDFGGWYDSLDFDDDPVPYLTKDDYGDKKYYARWIPTNYTISCYKLDAPEYQRFISYNIETETFTLFHPEKGGNTFIGWTSYDEEPVLDVVIPKGTTGNLYFDAHWEPNVYDIEYYDGDTKLEGIEPSTYVYWENDPLGPQPDKDGYIKGGWYTTSDFQEGTQIVYIPDDCVEVLKVYAKYDERQDTYWEVYPAPLDNLVYTGESQDLITPGKAVGGDAYYRVNSDDFSDSVPTFVDAGEYRVEYKIVDDDDEDIDTGWFFVNVEKASSNVTTHPVLQEGPFEYSGDTIHFISQDGEADGGTIMYGLDGKEFPSTWDSIGAIDAGEYTIYYRCGGDSNHHESETYTLTATINKMTPDKYVPPVANDLVYNAADQELVTGADAHSGTVLYSLDQENWSTDIPKATDAGQYTVYYKVQEDSNHFGTESAPVQASISKADPTWIIRPIPAIIGYNGSPQPLVAISYPMGGSTVYKMDPSGEYSKDIPTATNVGIYKVYYKIAGDPNHNDSAEGFIDVTISKGQIKPAVTIADWEVGATPSQPVLSGNPGGGDVIYEYKGTSEEESAYTGTVPTDIGTYNIRATVSETDNYLGGQAVGTFSITKHKLELTLTIEDWTYGQDAKAPNLSGNVGGGEVSYMYKLKIAGDTGYIYAVPVKAGTYTVRATVAETDYYLGGIVTADFTIDKAPLSLIVSIEGWTYGEEANKPSVTGNIGGGEVSYVYKLKDASEESYSKDVPVNAGTYTVKATAAETENYCEGTATVDFVIEKVPISPTVTIEGWTYGEKAKEPSVTGNPGEGAVTYEYKLKEASEESYSKDIPVNAGTYTVKATVAETQNYFGETATADFEIKKAAISPVVTIEGWTYGDDANKPSVTGNPGDGDVTFLYKEKEASEESYVSDMPVNAGAYTAKATVAETANYLGGTATADFTIAKAAISPVVTIEGWTYGDDANKPSVAGNPGQGAVTYEYKLKEASEESYVLDPPKDAGTYTVKATVAETANYLGSTATEDFTIAKAPISPVVTIEGWTYGDDANKPSVTGNPGQGAVTYEYKLKEASEESYSKDVPVNAGTYTVKATVAETANYLGETATADFEIKKAAISPVVTIEGWTYGDDANKPTVTGNPEKGAVTFEYKLKEASEESYSKDVPVNAGTYTLKVTVAETANYLGGVATADFTIAKAPISPVVTIEGWTYGDDANKPSVTGNPGQGAVTYEYKLKEASEESYSKDVPVNAGTYTVKATVAETANYLGGVATADFTIAKAPITPIVSIDGWTYGDDANKPFVTGNPGQGAVTYEYKLKEASEESYSKDVPVNAGTYTVKATVAETANYLGETATADFEIKKAAISPVVTIEGWTYGDDANKPFVTGNPGQGAVTYEYKLKEASEESYASDVPVNAGTYTVKATVAETANYLGGTDTADFTIAKAPISPVVTIEGWEYVDDPNSPSVSGNPGEGAVTYMYKLKEASEESYASDVPVNAGTYTVKATVSETANYLGGTDTTDFTISRSTAVVTADSFSKVYGSEDPEFTAVVTGLKAGDPASLISYTLFRAVGEDVGTYVISVSAKSTDNYDVATVSGELEITKKDAIVDADDAFKTEGDDDPELTYSVYGLIPGDTLEGIVLARTAGEDVGLYTIYFASPPVNGNYNIICHNGMFFITSKPMAEEHEDGTVTYTSQDDYQVDEDTTISILIVETDDKDGNLLSVEYSQSLRIKDIDEHGKDRITVTTADTQEINLEGGGKRVIETDEIKVVSWDTDVEGKDILLSVTSSLITDNNAGSTTVTEKCTVEDNLMVTEAVSVVGDEYVAVTTDILNKDAGSTISMIDVMNAKRQMTISLEHIEDPLYVDRTVMVFTGASPLMEVSNEAFAFMADSEMTFTVTSDCGSISYDSDVAATFADYDKPVTVQMESNTYDQLSDVQKAAIPADSLVLSVSAVSGDTVIKSLGGESTISFPYVVQEGWFDINVFYLDEEGVLHREKTEYRDGILYVTMDHHSDIVVLQTYSILMYQQGEGEFIVTPSSAMAGETVVLKAIPAEGYVFDGWEIDPEISINDGIFVMPSSDVAILVKFKRTGPAPGPAVQSISVLTEPVRTSYTEGERFDPSGLVLTVTYDDGSMAEVTFIGNEKSFSFEPSIVKTLKRSDSTIKIIYGEVSCDVNVSVRANNSFADNAVWICSIVIVVAAIAVIAELLIRRKRNS